MLKSVILIQAIMTYSMSVFLLPKKLYKVIDSIMLVSCGEIDKMKGESSGSNEHSWGQQKMLEDLASEIY